MQSSLVLRILSASVLAPVALACVWWGWPAFELLVLLAGVLMAREGADLVGGGDYRHLVAGMALTVLLLPLLRLPILYSLAASAAAALALYVGLRHRREASWLAAVLLVATVPCLGLAWLRSMPAQGLALVVWLLAIVWATDIGAYVFGRLIGGPKLAPRISPNKTWAGFFGGLISAVLAGLALGAWGSATGWIPRHTDLAMLALASAVLSLIGQAGDLAESAAKRRFGVKDSGHLIPGHGGMLDRLDSLLAVAPALALWVGLLRLDGMLWP